jgi:UDP-N-acetylmuramoylalanine--D-glutamate ligase
LGNRASRSRGGARHGCRLRIADTREAPPNLAALQAEGIDAEFVGGPFTPALLDGGIDIVMACRRSSGARRSRPRANARSRCGANWNSSRRRCARSARAATSRRCWRSPAPTARPRTSLTGLLCERAGKKVAVAGNISPAMLDRLASAIDETALPDVWVLELSSFQLETARTFAPDAAAILNITQDHLDWHGSFDAYAAAKAASSARRPRAC